MLFLTAATSELILFIFFVEFRFDGFELFVFVNFLTALVVSLDFGDALLFVERDPYDKR